MGYLHLLPSWASLLSGGWGLGTVYVGCLSRHPMWMAEVWVHKATAQKRCPFL